MRLGIQAKKEDKKMQNGSRIFTKKLDDKTAKTHGLLKIL